MIMFIRVTFKISSRFACFRIVCLVIEFNFAISSLSNVYLLTLYSFVMSFFPSIQFFNFDHARKDGERPQQHERQQQQQQQKDEDNNERRRQQEEGREKASLRRSDAIGDRRRRRTRRPLQQPPSVRSPSFRRSAASVIFGAAGRSNGDGGRRRFRLRHRNVVRQEHADQRRRPGKRRARRRRAIDNPATRQNIPSTASQAPHPPLLHHSGGRRGGVRSQERLGAITHIIRRRTSHDSRHWLPDPLWQRLARQEARDAQTSSSEQARPSGSDDSHNGDAGWRRDISATKAPSTKFDERGLESEVGAAPESQSSAKTRSHRSSASKVVRQGGPKSARLLQSSPRGVFKGTEKEARLASSSSSSILSQALATSFSTAEHFDRHLQPAAEELHGEDERIPRLCSQHRAPEVRGRVRPSSPISLPSR